MPKHGTAAFLLSLLLTAMTYAQQAEPEPQLKPDEIEICKWVSLLARAIMTER